MAGRNILVSWTSKYCPSGNPGDLLEGEDVYLVNGPQGTVDYAEQDLPELGIVPFSCVWAARGTVTSIGTITWLAPEQITSGRRDAIQLGSAVAGQAGFALIWQEDPEGLRPGTASGPGSGLTGATVNPKTDVWYSVIKWGDFLKSLDNTINEDGKDRVAVTFSSPVRVSDNAACKFVDGTNQGAPYCEGYCVSISPDGFCVTADGVELDGNTGASRPNLFLQAKRNADGVVIGAEAILGYEETKGLGEGRLVDPEDIGKNVIYHHFPDFTVPEVIAAGHILNLPELGANGQPLLSSDGSLLYENARRIRFILQPKGQKGKSGLVLAAIWKQGPEGKGRPSDVLMRRALNGYEPERFECTQWWRGPQGETCIQGTINLSSPSVLATDPTAGDGEKATSWEWTKQNLDDATTDNPYDDARAHRGILRGDFLVTGFTWTPSWAAARNGNDLYDFYIRRSFDGGKSWTNLHNQFEPPVNLSNLQPGRNETAIEPRIVSTPGTVTNPDGTPTGNPDDVQNDMVYFVSYGTAENVDTNVLDDEDDEPKATPLDLYWSWTDDYGESYELVQSPNTGRFEFGSLAKIELVEEGEAQLRANPAGTRVDAIWLAEGESTGPCQPGDVGGSDICFRRISGLAPLAVYDTDDDGDLDLEDRSTLAAAIADCDERGGLGCDLTFDFNGEGTVDSVDMKLWQDAYAVYLSQTG